MAVERYYTCMHTAPGGGPECCEKSLQCRLDNFQRVLPSHDEIDEGQYDTAVYQES